MTISPINTYDRGQVYDRSSRQLSVNVLTQTDLTELTARAQSQGQFVDSSSTFETQMTLPPIVGQGGDRIIHLRDGLTLQIRQATLRNGIRLEQHHDAEFPITAKFYLSGTSQVHTQRPIAPKTIETLKTDYIERASCHYLYHLPDLTETEEWQADELIQVVMVYANVNYFRSLRLNESLLHSLQQRFHYALGRITPAMQQVLQQILQCPYEGVTQQLYLESKALELLALQFATWKTVTAPAARLTLPAGDTERLYQARAILLESVTNPPSLLELARQVGLNDRKLKQGFRQLFGTTVFGYLHDYRMQQAQQLLQQSQMTVAQVASQVGYRNPEAFSTAFRRKFQISPKAYQLGQRE